MPGIFVDEYFKRLPSFAYEQDILYLRPKKNVTDTDTIWYDCTPVGKNTLGTMLKSMCKEAQIEEKSNHSLRATGATAMFRANVPEGVIQKTTGHRNLQCFCTYERISTNQHEEVSKLLMGDFIKESKLHVPVSTAKNSSDSQTTEISTDVASCDTGTSNSSTLADADHSANVCPQATSGTDANQCISHNETSNDLKETLGAAFTTCNISNINNK